MKVLDMSLNSGRWTTADKVYLWFGITVVFYSFYANLKLLLITGHFFNEGGKFLKKLWCCVGGRV